MNVQTWEYWIDRDMNQYWCNALKHRTTMSIQNQAAGLHDSQHKFRQEASHYDSSIHNSLSACSCFYQSADCASVIQFDFTITSQPRHLFASLLQSVISAIPCDTPPPHLRAVFISRAMVEFNRVHLASDLDPQHSLRPINHHHRWLVTYSTQSPTIFQLQ